MVKVYMHGNNLYTHKISDDDKEYKLALSPFIVMEDNNPTVAFLYEEDAKRYCNLKNSKTYTYKPFEFYEMIEYGIDACTNLTEN